MRETWFPLTPLSFDFSSIYNLKPFRLSPTAVGFFAHTTQTHAARTCTYTSACNAHAFCTDRCERGVCMFRQISGATRACGGCSVMGTKPDGSFPGGQVLCFPLESVKICGIAHCSIFFFQKCIGGGGRRPAQNVHQCSRNMTLGNNTHTQRKTLTAN